MAKANQSGVGEKQSRCDAETGDAMHTSLVALASMCIAILSQAAKDRLWAIRKLEDKSADPKVQRKAQRMLDGIDRWAKILSPAQSPEGFSLLGVVKIVNQYLDERGSGSINYHVVKEILLNDPARLDIQVGGRPETVDSSAAVEKDASALVQEYSAYLEDHPSQDMFEDGHHRGQTNLELL